MSFDADDEIVQDFLVEAGEILEQLGEQLVDLEQNPTDADLLNAVFRGFHTIKGGASFIGLTNMVEICHVAEDVFNLLRNGEKQVTAHLMDVILQVLDVLNDMFDGMRNGIEPAAADPELVRQLKALLSDDDAAQGAAPAEATEQASAEPAAASETPTSEAGDISDSEFEKLLGALDDQEEGQAAEATAAPEAVSTGATSAAADDEITEEEFEALLDQLHGGAAPGMSPAEEKPAPAAAQPAPEQASGAGDDEITEEEFEALLDQLHGKGKGPGAEAAAAAEQTPPAEPVPAPPAQAGGAAAAAVAVQAEPQPEPKAEPKPQAKPAAKAEPKAAAKAKEAPAAETTVRVDTKRLDDIMNMVGELVLVRNRLVTLENSLGNEEIAQAISNLDLVTADLQASVMKTRMQPIKKVFGRFPRVVRDLARNLKKEVQLELQGEDTDLDKNLVEALADPLVHLVRNAVDHGIEMPDVREKAGKPRKGTVLLSAEQEGDHILLTISDDGGGMDPDKLRALAVEKGVLDQESADRLTEKECYNLIFAPGFSTKQEISDISGRGVGMDVVKTRIVQLNGSIDITSELGVGTRLQIKVPLTLAIMPTLMVKLEQQIFALPLVSVNEIFNLDLTNTNVVDGQIVIMLRDHPLPLYFLKDWLVQGAMGQPHPEQGHVVVVTIGEKKVGFVVEHLIGQEEVVIKPLGAFLQGTRGLAGATITGDGRIALILDVPSLVSAYAGHY